MSAEDSEFNAAVQAAMFPPKPGRKPLPIGTWVTGVNQIGLLGLIGHKDHIFEIGKTHKKVEWSNSGYQQDVICIVCDTLHTHVDGEFLQKIVTRFYAVEVYKNVKADISRLKVAKKRIQDKFS